MLGHANNDQATLLGFLIRDTDADWAEMISMEPGLSVLYGLNGAGKSRTIHDISQFWDGKRSAALALIRLPDGPASIDWYRETDRGDWYPDWARRGDLSSGVDSDVILRAWLEACLAANDITVPGQSPRPERLERLVEEWMSQRLILVQAAGTQEDKRWISAPAFLTGHEFPEISAEVALYETVESRDAWDEHDGEWYLTPCANTADGRTVSCGSLYGIPAVDRLQWFFSAAQHDRLLDLSTTLVSAPADVDERTRWHLRTHVGDLVTVADGKAIASQALHGHVRKLEDLANGHFAEVLQDAPRLRLHVAPVGLDQQVEWFVEDDERTPTLEPHPENPPTISLEAWERARSLTGLSTAQRRWALWSIEMALAIIEADDDLRLILVDEPESALHRSAEKQMADYIAGLAADGGTHVMVATHSPELLDLGPARVYEVARRRGRRRLSPLTTVTRQNMRDLGLLPSDLLRRQRAFILVEGEHDVLVLRELFGPELEHLRVEVLPIRGTHQLSPAKIRFLFEYTPAHVFIMVDNIATAELADAWEAALQHHNAAHHDLAVRELERASCLRTEEGKKVREVLQHALVTAEAERVTPHGLSHADVIEYLPVDALVPGTASWQELREAHRADRNRDRQAPKDFKTWLRVRHSADFSPESLRAAVTQLDVIPPDFLRLLKTIEARVG